METIKLFQIYKINDQISDALNKEIDIETNFIMPVFISDDNVLFCEIRKKSKYQNKNQRSKQITLYTKKKYTDYVIELLNIYRIPIEIFKEQFNNVHYELLKDNLAEVNELEILDAFVESLEQNLFASKLITINLKTKNAKNCY
ncbi:hypothetical protein ACX1M3_02595 [Mycoplasma sp. Z463D]